MLRLLLLLVLIGFVARAFWRVVDGILEAMQGGRSVEPRGSRPGHSVQMARDPVCGTFVLPDRAIALSVRGQSTYFCSVTCRDAFLADGSGRAHGRPA